MVNKTGTQYRAERRQVKLETELILLREDKYEGARLRSKKDNDLYVLDNIFAPNIKKKMHSKISPYKEINKFVKAEDSGEVEKMLLRNDFDSEIKLSRLHRECRKKNLEPSNLFDLWTHNDIINTKKGFKNTLTVKSENNESCINAAAKLKRKNNCKIKKNLEKSPRIVIAEPGQSFHPDKKQHQDTIDNALKIELHRKDFFNLKSDMADKEKIEPSLLQFLVMNSDQEIKVDDINGIEPIGYLRRNKKLTRTQKNKKKQKKLKINEEWKEKRQKNLLNSVLKAKEIIKEINERESFLKRRRKRITEMKIEEKCNSSVINSYKNTISRNPKNTKSYPVALTEEIFNTGGNLRKLIPKGDLLTERLESMIQRKLLYRGNIKNRKRKVQDKNK